MRRAPGIATLGPVECAVSGSAAAEHFLEAMNTGACPRGDELLAAAQAVAIAYGWEGSRAFLRRIQKALEEAT